MVVLKPQKGLGSIHFFYHFDQIGINVFFITVVGADPLVLVDREIGFG